MRIKDLRPDSYAEGIWSIDFEELYRDMGITHYIIDLDNTLRVKGFRLDPRAVRALKREIRIGHIQGLLVLTNSIIPSKARLAERAIRRLERQLEIPVQYVCLDYHERKPKVQGFERAISLLDRPKDQIAVIGDQMMSDIKGGKRLGLFTILVEPLDHKGYSWASRVSLRVFRNTKVKKKLGLV